MCFVDVHARRTCAQIDRVNCVCNEFVCTYIYICMYVLADMIRVFCIDRFVLKISHSQESVVKYKVENLISHNLWDSLSLHYVN